MRGKMRVPAMTGRVFRIVTQIDFRIRPPRDNRIHHLTPADLRLVLARLPPEVYARLEAVHFVDLGPRVRELGCVQPGHREIALCALPPAINLNGFMFPGQEPAMYGATWDAAWPALAIRRFLLYDVFLHELGHMQIVQGKNGPARRRFADEVQAHEFALSWRDRLWSDPLESEDPVHRAP